MSAVDDARVLVVGAGPAGFSAALWLTDFDVPFHWIDASGEVGGMLGRVHNDIDNYPGGTYDDGAALREVMRAHREDRGIILRTGELTGVEWAETGVSATVDESTRGYDRLLLATGTSYRRLGVPGEAEGLGRWVSQSAMADAPRFAGRPVAVIGGGDSGFENALVLAEQDCPVTLLLRSPPRARPTFANAVDDHTGIEIAPIPSVVTGIEPRDEGCRVHVEQRDRSVTLDVACLFVRIGVDPVVPPGCKDLETDDRGFLVVDENGRTSRRPIFAAGDVTSTPLRSVATSVGQAARAARRCAADLGYL